MNKRNIILCIMLSFVLNGCDYESTDSKTTKVKSSEDGSMTIAIKKSNETNIAGDDNEPLVNAKTSIEIESDGTLANTKVNTDASLGDIKTIEDIKEYVGNLSKEEILDSSKIYADKLLKESTIISANLLEKTKAGITEGGEMAKGYIKEWFNETWEEAKKNNKEGK